MTFPSVHFPYTPERHDNKVEKSLNFEIFFGRIILYINQ